MIGQPHISSASGQLDPVERRRLFEAAHPEVTILPPVRAWERWRAIVPLVPAPGQPDTTTVGEIELSRLMDKLDRLVSRPDPA